MADTGVATETVKKYPSTIEATDTEKFVSEPEVNVVECVTLTAGNSMTDLKKKVVDSSEARRM